VADVAPTFAGAAGAAGVAGVPVIFEEEFNLPFAQLFFLNS